MRLSFCREITQARFSSVKTQLTQKTKKMKITDKQAQFLRSLIIKTDRLIPSEKEKYGLYLQINKLDSLFKSEASEMIGKYLKAIEANKIR